MNLKKFATFVRNFYNAIFGRFFARNLIFFLTAVFTGEMGVLSFFYKEFEVFLLLGIILWIVWIVTSIYQSNIFIQNENEDRKVLNLQSVEINFVGKFVWFFVGLIFNLIFGTVALAIFSLAGKILGIL